MSSFRDFLGNLFRMPSKSTNREVIVSGGDDYAVCTNAINSFAVISVIDMIASMCACAELKTYRAGIEHIGYEWYNLNVKPNANQSATEFWTEFYSTLLWEGEVLVVPVNGQKIIAESFSIEEYALRENIFTGVYRKGFTFSKVFKASEVFYIRYSNHRLKSILADIEAVYNQLFNEAANKYIKSGGSKGVMEISTAPSGDVDFEEKYSESISNRLRKFNQAKDGVLTLFEGMKYNPNSTPSNAKSSNEITDIKNLFDAAVTRAAQAFKIPPQLMLGDVSGIDDAINLMLTVCIDPLLYAVSEEFSGKEFTADEYIAGNYIAADTTNIKHIDIFSLAPNIEKLITSALLSPEETRGKAGLSPINEEWAKQHFYTKNMAPVTELNQTGGENNE